VETMSEWPWLTTDTVMRDFLAGSATKGALTIEWTKFRFFFNAENT